MDFEIIDFRVRPQMPVFFDGIWPETRPEFVRYWKLYKADERKHLLDFISLEESTKNMQEAGVGRAVIAVSDALDNIDVYNAVTAFPDAYIGLASINIAAGITEACDELEKAYKEYGLVGLDLNPYLMGIYANDPKLYPLYALSSQMNKSVHIHCSINYSSYEVMDIGHPKYIDRVAVDFPNLRIVMRHAGRGFGQAAGWVVDRHRNVYIDVTALHPRYMDPLMLMAINTILRKKTIYGSSFPLLEYNVWEEWQHIIQQGNHQFFFRDNALRALGLES